MRLICLDMPPQFLWATEHLPEQIENYLDYYTNLFPFFKKLQFQSTAFKEIGKIFR